MHAHILFESDLWFKSDLHVPKSYKLLIMSNLDFLLSPLFFFSLENWNMLTWKVEEEEEEDMATDFYGLIYAECYRGLESSGRKG